MARMSQSLGLAVMSSSDWAISDLWVFYWSMRSWPGAAGVVLFIGECRRGRWTGRGYAGL